MIGANANSIPMLDFMCTACIAFGGFYCYDDPWEVNFNGDKCYENAVDRLNCEGFEFSNNVTKCYGSKLEPASECNKNELAAKFLEWYMPYTFFITLEPRSMCSMSVTAHSAIMETNHTFPVTVYHNPDGEEISHLDI